MFDHFNQRSHLAWPEQDAQAIVGTLADKVWQDPGRVLRHQGPERINLIEPGGVVQNA
jgi:hypothetical protein